MSDTRCLLSLAAGFAGGFVLFKLLSREADEDADSSPTVRPTKTWPKKFAFKLTPGSKNTQFISVGPLAKQKAAAAKNDLDILDAACAGFGHMVDNFSKLEKDWGFKVLDCSAHPLQADIVVEDIKYKVRDNGDGTRDVMYISLHVCKMEWPKMMDVYHDRREVEDTEARNYSAVVPYQEPLGKTHERIYHTLIKDETTAYGASDTIMYCSKVPHKTGRGELAFQSTIECKALPEHPFVYRNTKCQFAGSGMFNSQKKGISHIYCVRDQTIFDEDDLYDTLIKGMAAATEQQIVYARSKGHSSR